MVSICFKEEEFQKHMKVLSREAEPTRIEYELHYFIVERIIWEDDLDLKEPNKTHDELHIFTARQKL